MSMFRLGPVACVLTTQRVLMGDKDGKPATLAGELRIPTGGADRIPAVILIHGASGVLPAVVDRWVPVIKDVGIATNQIAILGFSKGAIAAVQSSDERFRESYAPKNVEFAAHIGMYTPCNTTYRDDDKVTGKPIRLFHGIADDWIPIEPCRQYVARLKKVPADVALTEYPNAYHGYDFSTQKKEPTKLTQAVNAIVSSQKAMTVPSWTLRLGSRSVRVTPAWKEE